MPCATQGQAAQWVLRVTSVNATLWSMKNRGKISKTKLIFGSVFLLGVLGCYSLVHSYQKVVFGTEYPAEEKRLFLNKELGEHFSWSALPPLSVEHAWVNGFRDHISLYRIRIAPDVFRELKQSVLGVKGDHITSDDRDDLGLCPFGFATTSPQGRAKIPAWWEAAALRHFDSVKCHALLWQYWFAYDNERQILFLFASNG